MQDLTHGLHKITSSPSIQKLLYLHKAAALDMKSLICTCHSSKNANLDFQFLCTTEKSVRKNNSLCTQLLGGSLRQFHSSTLVENLVLEAAIAILTIIEVANDIIFMPVLFKFDD